MQLYTEYEKLEGNEDGLILLDGQLFTGISKRFYKGFPLSEFTYKKGKRNGLGRGWYVDTDALQFEYNYQNGTLHGSCREWYEMGQKKSITFYEMGVTIEKKVWDQFGQLVKEYHIENDPSMLKTLHQFRQIYG